MKLQKEANKEKGCRYTFISLCILIIAIAVLLLTSCSRQIHSVGYYPYRYKHQKSISRSENYEDIWNTTRTNHHFLNSKKR